MMNVCFVFPTDINESTGRNSESIKGLKRKKVVAQNQLKKIPKSPIKKQSQTKKSISPAFLLHPGSPPLSSFSAVHRMDCLKLEILKMHYKEASELSSKSGAQGVINLRATGSRSQKRCRGTLCCRACASRKLVWQRQQQ